MALSFSSIHSCQKKVLILHIFFIIAFDMRLQYGWNLREIRLYGNLAGSAGLILNWSGWNRGNGQARLPLN